MPKWRRKTLYGKLRQHLGEVFRKLAQQKKSRIEEGHLMPDHVHMMISMLHMMISMPPKYPVLQIVGFIKGKSAIHLARVYGEKKRNFVGQHFWARGYFGKQVVQLSAPLWRLKAGQQAPITIRIGGKGLPRVRRSSLNPASCKSALIRLFCKPSTRARRRWPKSPATMNTLADAAAVMDYYPKIAAR